MMINHGDALWMRIHPLEDSVDLQMDYESDGHLSSKFSRFQAAKAMRPHDIFGKRWIFFSPHFWLISNRFGGLHPH